MNHFQQDWIIHLLLESIGIMNVTVGYDSFPQYNAALAFEIYDNDGVPEVEVECMQKSWHS